MDKINKPKRITCLVVSLIMACTVFGSTTLPAYAAYQKSIPAFSYNGFYIPAYDGDPSEIINSNDPTFTTNQKTQAVSPFQSYSSLDGLGRCGVAYASLDESLMPTWTRGSISSIYPTGWIQASYSVVPGSYLYNRCHLIGFQLTGVDNENSMKAYCRQNLITGTRYLNVGTGGTGMVGYENAVASYINENPDKNVLYRVTPVFTGNDLVAKGVIMEAESVEGPGIEYCVFCYNVQPGVSIDYATGASISGNIVTPPAIKVVPKLKAPKWSKVKVKKKSIYIKWKKVSGAKGYQIAYRKMGPNKYKYIKTTKTSKTIKKLKSKKYHQVKVRAYKTVSGKKVYGPWSKVKKKKVK